MVRPTTGAPCRRNCHAAGRETSENAGTCRAAEYRGSDGKWKMVDLPFPIYHPGRHLSAAWIVVELPGPAAGARRGDRSARERQAPAELSSMAWRNVALQADVGRFCRRRQTFSGCGRRRNFRPAFAEATAGRRATELRATSYELRATSYELRATNPDAAKRVYCP